jgi:mannitol-specific phosphotransferase system IIBC component
MKKTNLIFISSLLFFSCSSGSSSIGSIDLRDVIKEALKNDVVKKAVKEVAEEEAKEAVDEKAKEVVVEKAQETINDALQNSEEEI